MKAMRVTRTGPNTPFEAYDKPDAAPGPNQVAIRVHAAGLNAADVKIRDGSVPIGTDRPVLGFDAAGAVVAVGPGVTRFKEGDEVYGCVGGLPGSDSAFSERMVADARLLARKPGNLDFREAAALPLAVITAWEALVDRAAVKPGELVLVHGGAGGVGSFGIQIAKAMGGIVHSTVSSEDKAAIVRELWADAAINYRDMTVADYVEHYTGGRGYDVVLDTVGDKNIERSMEALALNGRLACIVPSETLNPSLMSGKNASLHMVLMLIPLMTGEDRERHGRLLEHVTRLVEAGRLKPLVDPKRFALEDIEAAFDHFASGQAIGKIVLDIP